MRNNRALNINMETPSYSHLTAEDYNNVYEPSEDSFILLDALELDLQSLRERKPSICLEIGSGSGIIITALAKYLESSSFIAVDINKSACNATARTSKANNANVDVINMDLLSSFKENSIDLLIFNPPYVPTPLDESETSNIPEHRKMYDDEANEVFQAACEDKLLIRSWAGGADGCQIINRVINSLNQILAKDGIFYLLIIKDNNPERIKNELYTLGFQTVQVIDRKIRGEHLIVLKITRR